MTDSHFVRSVRLLSVKFISFFIYLFIGLPGSCSKNGPNRVATEFWQLQSVLYAGPKK